ncbi:P-loop containing nucleoside triphosphate hydrolase protein [Roridomyces roridus]|uniref:P-loop containing nucleoside triphosphate hydrolase protein n=1 Tax=Roridomyces roridus TaxID=1738132 RepID=A0AAD7F9P5_9AGAR|nr:P-loop containing nucleoside triphosphate hydrolase protein [Roridomyces roridus]
MNPLVEEASKPVSHSRILRYDEYFDLRTFAKTLRKTAKPAKKINSKKTVLVVRRIIDEKGQHSGTEVDIKSTALCQLLLSINAEVEGGTLTVNNPTMLSKELFHCRPGLLKRLEEEQARSDINEDLINDISTALQFVEEDYSATLGDLNLLAHNEISYELLWVVFQPNALVYRYHPHTEQDQLLLLRTLEYKRRPNGSYYVELACDCINDDGTAFGLAREIIEIDAFRGARRIQDLIAFPLSHHTRNEQIRAMALERGKKFIGLKKHSYHEISGPAMREKMNEAWEYRQFKFSTRGRVMIDPVAFRLFEPNCTYNFRVHRRLERDRLTDQQHMICTPIALGFCFGVKMWGGFALDRLEDIAWSEEAFQELVLGPKQKKLIHSLFKSHSARAAVFDDIVKGKGKGLIGLFCGSPGTGKTLTAEALAEMTHRPLYSVSAGELGTEPKELDEKLTLILEIAQTWNAVLLLDESEVFLQRRSSGDVTRNALVSIFLRQLEYYQGIMILTTNLIEQCDDAFESRIHFSIRYPDLGVDSRKEIWQKFFKKVLKNSTDISSQDLDRLAKIPMNGRQVRV